MSNSNTATDPASNGRAAEGTTHGSGARMPQDRPKGGRQALIQKAQLLLKGTHTDDPAGATNHLCDRQGLSRDEAAEIVAEAMEANEDGLSGGEHPHLTDTGNAERLVDAFGDRIRYVYEHRRWLAWDGTRWAPDATGAVEEYAKRTVRRMYADAAEIEKDDARESVVKWARQSESAHALRAMMSLAHSDRKVSIRDADLDNDPWTLNVANGTVDLRTGDRRPHDSAEMHSKVAGAGYVPGVEAPRWQAFLERVLPDAEVREFVHKLAGYSVAGEVGENVLPFPYGPGANGKSVFLGVLREVLGDYATEAAPDLLVARRERGIPVDVADLRGYRFVTTTEVEGGRQMASDVMKRITGEPRLKARKMRQDFESFVNVTKLWMAANDRPRVDGLDEAIWRRIRLIPFDVTIPPTERDPDLMRKLLEERDGILTWAIEGCLAYGRDGLIPPRAVMAATDEYRSDSNPLLEWVDADCELDATASTGRAALRESYERYCKRTYAKPVPARSSKWAAALEELGCRIEREGGARVWGGIKLADRENTGLGV